MLGIYTPDLLGPDMRTACECLLERILQSLEDACGRFPGHFLRLPGDVLAVGEYELIPGNLSAGRGTFERLAGLVCSALQTSDETPRGVTPSRPLASALPVTSVTVFLLLILW